MNLPPPPTLVPSLYLVDVDALAAALIEFGITSVSANALLEAVKQQEDRKHKEVNESASKRRRALLNLVSRPPDRSLETVPPYKSTFVANPKPSEALDEVAKERRRRLRKLAKDTFPDGKFPEPYTATWLNQYNDSSVRCLPFIGASIVVTPDSDANNPPRQEFLNVRCLGHRCSGPADFELPIT